MWTVDIHTTGSAAETTSHEEMAKELIAKNPTMYHSWSLVYQRVLPQLHLHLLLHNLHHRIPYLMSTDTPKIQYQKEVEVRVKSFGEDPLHESTENENKNKNGEREEVQRDMSHELPDWLQELKGKFWLMKVLQQGLGETQTKGVKTLPNSSHELPMEPRAKVEIGSGKHSVYTLFPKDPHCDICLKTKITRASCRRRIGKVVPGAVHFGDLITADHKILSEESESRNNHRYAVVVQDLATQWIQSYPSKSKSPQETQKSLVKFLEPTRKPKVIYTENSYLVKLVKIFPGIIVR